MKINKRLILCLAIPLGVGGLAAWLARGSMETFASLNQPPLSPPGWLFPIVWTILYAMMGWASWLALSAGQTRALRLYGIQLAFNFLWTLIFFNLNAYLLAFIWLILMWILILATGWLFYRITRPAGLLMLPYLLWVSFAGYLNLGIYLLN